MPSPVDPPESPPVGPVIPVGLATRIGQIAAAVFALIALVTAVLDGDHSQETIVAMILGGGSVLTLMFGRYLQAAFAYLGDVWGIDPNDASGQPDRVPSEGELQMTYRGDPPAQEPSGEWRPGDPTVPPGSQPGA